VNRTTVRFQPQRVGENHEIKRRKNKPTKDCNLRLFRSPFTCLSSSA